ncbi:DNA polymerase III subunit gamma and tau [Aeromicrobium wangtongii]|uniref:DNA polymerase III subunit gamma/tau n=1 Tax=Aeromicrobium wangtongii TaxID=2969247 RepID=A0ABY5M9Z3_9ACTN|nr:DNA polymerase III subunit gamma and tau [Aeromicrobium wangtongii]MCD9199591.1 DNA polymerase III subunit gamma and tau [Aeromicrobium wangtongii]UUP13944.1 DNA polymerase III subunit gamma and tau [Aeromicrobium wangtongii]
MDAPLALYRRYRPETFAEVIGQEHVTDPLRHALAANKVNHAYLFSGPRGCGKTTSARILARALNCEKAPISDPCGECQSCRDLARGGPGSIDVIEIDAASHGGVDDARDLRERAFFAPVSSRYKVYIIDEAHMVSPQGFNALLKLVEEPPPHLKFIFATTEPDKVIGTIRSRTHHYPFRLVPPKVLGDYLMQLCRAEGVELAPTALPLVVRAGQGSVRDTLSVLDQLLGGAGPEGVTYDLAVQLLGYTPDSLLDEAIDAFAASDGGVVFGVVDKVIESGQDPRRFAEDLLQRLRDLVIVAAVPDALDKGLLDVPGDRAERLVAQSNGFGPSELTRAADIVNAALMEFRGATAPRLLLELMCARILVPGADNSTQGFQARLDRIERRLGVLPAGAAPASAVDAAPPAVAAPAPQPVAPQPPAPQPPAPQPVASQPPAPQPVASQPVDPPVAEPAPVAPPVSAEPAPVAAAAPGQLTIADVRRLWPEILDKIRDMRRFAWIMLSQNAQVMGLDGNILTIALVNTGARDSFLSSGSDEYVQRALNEVLGVTWRIEAIVDPGARPGVDDHHEERPPTRPPVAESGPPVAVPDSVRAALRESHTPMTREDPDASADRNDPVVEVEDLDPEALLSRELGAQVIDETRND